MTTKLQGKIGGVDVELDRPEPVEQDGVWYEAVEYHIPKCDELYFYNNELLRAFGTDNKPWWIMRPIPAPTPAQLKAIGMKLDVDKPRECRDGDNVWDYDGETNGQYTVTKGLTHWQTIGTYRWHLVKADTAKATGEREIKTIYCFECHYLKRNLCQLNLWNNGGCLHFWKKPHDDTAKARMERESWQCVCGIWNSFSRTHCKICERAKPPVAQVGKVHTDCAGCYFNVFVLAPKCRTCCDDPMFIGTIRKNWTDAPQTKKREGATIKTMCQLKLQAKAWEEVFDLCQSLGMDVTKTNFSGTQDVCAFIRDLHRRASFDEPYFELLMAVAKKIPGEDRHDTALRYIRQTENQQSSVASQTNKRGTK
jgi:hypothetical protein